MPGHRMAMQRSGRILPGRSRRDFPALGFALMSGEMSKHAGTLNFFTDAGSQNRDGHVFADSPKKGA